MPLTIGPLSTPSVAVLAPMAGMTDLTFRLLCKEQGCGLVYTEVVNADCLLRGSKQSHRLVETCEDERPVGVQLYHHEPDVLAEAARWVAEHVTCDLIDLNMGCPVPKVVTKGAGAALMRDPRLVERLVRAVGDAVEGSGLPITAKTRSGWTSQEINAPDVARAVEAGGGACIAVHARTRAQRHEGPVDWELLAQIKDSVGIPVIGNGGIEDAEGALAMREATGVDAVMVGRGALGNPWIFRQIDDAWHGRPPSMPTVDERMGVLERHLRGAIQSNLDWARRDRDTESAELRAMRYVRGHLVRSVAGSPGEAKFRRRLSELNTVDLVVEALREAWRTPETTESGPTGLDRSVAAA